MDNAVLIALFTGFVIKHFIADFPLQTLWMAINKGTFLHLGGLAHSGIHVVASFIILLLALPWLNVGLGYILLLVIAEGIVHYIIDYTKMNLDRKLKYSYLVKENDVIVGRMITHGNYYNLLGIDQLLHYLTYAAMLSLLV